MDMETRAQIQDFLADYAYAIDDDEVERWPGFFTEDGVYQITTRENLDAGLPLGIMLCEGRGMMADRVEALRSANIYEPHSYCHVLGPVVLGADSDDAISARSNFQVIRTMQDGRTEIFAVGKYLDRIIMQDGQPKLARRQVVLESRRIDILMVYPL
ncbi:MAG: aromatic-ring-hydroxylating dioxygenase subunit beta [Rhodospirillaceae bacterium]|jgi:anthranilate 1,2-dioxygenase small subunit|nr:aromatic-ring-hydroxylating dioxygenase subunit beta [Rhodospirillaceae bacterium]